MKKFLNEFKTFALRGNVMDLAVGMIIGSAFTAIVTALKDNFIQPILDFVTHTHTADYYTKEVLLGYLSAFISAIINFIIIAFVLFLLIKGINTLMSIGKKKTEEATTEPTTKICPFCKSEIAIEAVRCAHCTSKLDE
ncbi:MAG: large conductance mechanosensitive channel protein MscL [Clostridia bacterium]|nr:large conductance mechanosensitive channel protein MscL [Clostridia bacterium]